MSVDTVRRGGIFMRARALVAGGVAAAVLAAASLPFAAAAARMRPAATPASCKPQLENQVHKSRATSDAWLDHGVSGTVLDVAGGIVGVQTSNGTIATVYVAAGKPSVAPGQTIAVQGTMKNGLIYASSVRVTGGRPWPAPTTPVQPTGAIKHVIFIIQENHSFDNYFGTYPGVVGLRPGIKLPLKKGGPPAIAPYHLTAPLTHDLEHDWIPAHRAYDNGKMDGFVYADQYTDVMGYYDGSDIPNYWSYAAHFTLDDMFFSSLMGPSLPNHLYTVAGSAGGWIWNMWAPPSCGFTFASVPQQLQAAHVSWRDYNGFAPGGFWLWNPLPGFTAFQHSAALRSGLVANTQYFRDLRDGNLASVSWITPDMLDSEHPPTDYHLGMWYVTDLLNALMESRYWSDTLVVVTWDEYGGFYDNVAPKQLDPYGFGFRVPALVISPYAKAGAIDATTYDFTSVLKYIEQLHGLAPISSRTAKVNSIGGSVDLRQAPLAPYLITKPLTASQVPKSTLP